MAGTRTGGINARNTNYKRYGQDFYREIGRKGGKSGGMKGFAIMDKEKVRLAGAKGGRKSRREPSKNKEEL